MVTQPFVCPAGIGTDQDDIGVAALDIDQSRKHRGFVAESPNIDGSGRPCRPLSDIREMLCMFCAAFRLGPAISHWVESGDQQKALGEHCQSEMGAVQFGQRNRVIDRGNRLIAALNNREDVLQHTGLPGWIDLKPGMARRTGDRIA
jgi:hypothetical protein